MSPAEKNKARNENNTAWPEAAVVPLRARKRLSRGERSASTRDAIFAAAAKVIGQYGYADASINRITAAAGIAQGTFYLYFESRQALFDQLLPNVGQAMLRFIGERVKDSKNIYDLEERGFRAFFDYLKTNPHFFRILNEAEVAAPVAHRKHFKATTQHYLDSWKRSLAAGEISDFDLEELEAVIYVLMAARTYLYMRYVKGSRGGSIPEKVVQAYMKLVRHGILADGQIFS